MGTKVGKARLSLFGLRPRKTAVVVTILTGSVISASTLAILFAADKQLRTGVFELEEIQGDLAAARRELEQTRDLKTEIERELGAARAEQVAAGRRLQATNKALRGVLQQLARAEETQEETEAALDETLLQLDRTERDRIAAEQEIDRVEAERERVRSQLQENAARQALLRREIRQLQGERQQLLAQRDAVRRQIAARDREIRQNQEQIDIQQKRLRQQNEQIEQRDRLLAEREAQLAQRETELADRESLLAALERQKAYLEREVQLLEQDAADFRQRKVAIVRNQVLASGVLRVIDPEATPQAVDDLLRAANQVAWQLLHPGGETVEAIVKITRGEVARLAEAIDDGEVYVVRVFSAENYVEGEMEVQVFVAALRNQVVFDAGETIAAVSIEPEMTEEEVLEQMELLLQAVRFRATREGILIDRIQIGDGERETLVEFLEQLQTYPAALEVEAIAANVTETADALVLELVARQDGEVVLEAS